MSHFFRLCLTVILLALSGATWAGAVTVADPMVRLLPPTTRHTAAFMVLRNTGDREVRLVRASTPAARAVELHTVVREGDVMKMRQVAEIAIKARGETALKPGGYHLMLIDLREPLREGQRVSLRLEFSDGRSETVDAPVRPVGAAGH